MSAINKLAAAVICGLVLTACGGGGGDNPPAPGNNTGGGTSNTQTSYTVTPSVNGSGGTISPAVAVSVKSGAATSFQVTPNGGYTATVSGTCGGTLSGTTYTTKAVTANCSVVATFAASGNALTLRYEAPSPAGQGLGTWLDDFLTLLNQEGAKGYRYLTGWSNPNAFHTSVSGPDARIFVNDGTAQTYTYELMPRPDNAADFVSLVNAEGAKGYRYQGDMMYGTGIGACLQNASTGVEFCLNPSLFRKDSGSSATYSYTTGTIPANAADFLTQANSLGQSGYLFDRSIGYNDSLLPTPIMLYVKNNASRATYTYEAPAWPSTPDALLAQYNSEGARGYLATFQYVWPNSIYVRDQTQAAVYTYQPGPADTDQTDITSLINHINSHGAQGYAYYHGVYVKASNCSGNSFCRALD